MHHSIYICLDHWLAVFKKVAGNAQQVSCARLLQYWVCKYDSTLQSLFLVNNACGIETICLFKRCPFHSNWSFLSNQLDLSHPYNPHRFFLQFYCIICGTVRHFINHCYNLKTRGSFGDLRGILTASLRRSGQRLIKRYSTLSLLWPCHWDR